jgi:hypothetical protein
MRERYNGRIRKRGIERIGEGENRYKSRWERERKRKRVTEKE